MILHYKMKYFDQNTVLRFYCQKINLNQNNSHFYEHKKLLHLPVHKRQNVCSRAITSGRIKNVPFAWSMSGAALEGSLSTETGVQCYKRRDSEADTWDVQW